MPDEVEQAGLRAVRAQGAMHAHTVAWELIQYAALQPAANMAGLMAAGWGPAINQADDVRKLGIMADEFERLRQRCFERIKAIRAACQHEFGERLYGEYITADCQKCGHTEAW